MPWRQSPGRGVNGEWKCLACGAINERGKTCEGCGVLRGRRGETVEAGEIRMRCLDCDQPTNTAQGAIVVTGRFLCLTCRMTRLQRATSNPEDRCTEPDCSLTAAQHIAEGTRIIAGAAWGERYETKRL